MGSDKALLKFRGRTLIELALEHASAVATRVRIVGSREKYAAYGEVIEDVYPGQGPLAGIHAALRASERDRNLILAVDAPLIELEYLRQLTASAEKSGAAVTVTRTSDGRLHPLCAVYRKSFADVAERALREKRNKIDALFAQVMTEYVEPAALGFDERMLANVNTPDDLDKIV
jgi:molybdopterin-guanine dinucleotide biosynthesis protein A